MFYLSWSSTHSGLQEPWAKVKSLLFLVLGIFTLKQKEAVNSLLTIYKLNQFITKNDAALSIL